MILKNKKSWFWMPTILFCDFGWFWKIKNLDFRRPVWKNGSNNLYEKIAQEVAILRYYKSQILWSYDKNFVLNPKLLISPTNAYLTIYRVSKGMYVWLWTQVFLKKTSLQVCLENFYASDAPLRGFRRKCKNDHQKSWSGIILKAAKFCRNPQFF